MKIRDTNDNNHIGDFKTKPMTDILYGKRYEKFRN